MKLFTVQGLLHDENSYYKEPESYTEALEALYKWVPVTTFRWKIEPVSPGLYNRPDMSNANYPSEKDQDIIVQLHKEIAELKDQLWEQRPWWRKWRW